MTCFLPSEVARLVLGYLKEEQCPKSYKTFLRECPFLNEYRLLLERGQECPTKIVGKGLKDMLEEYGQLKIQESSTGRDVWSKFDTVVTQLKNVATRSHLPSSIRPQPVATFQKKRAVHSRRFIQAKSGTENCSHSTSGGSTETLDIPQESVLSDAVSSPSSSVRDEEESSANSTGLQSLESQSHISVQSKNEVPGTSTPASNNHTNTQGQARFRHNLPINSPIVVSDSDHPFSPESNPSTPLRLDRTGVAASQFKDIQESPKSHLSCHNRQSPLVQSKRKNVGGSPVKFSKENIEYVRREGDLFVARMNKVKCVQLTKQEMQIQAMRTGSLSVLLEKDKGNSRSDSNNKPPRDETCTMASDGQNIQSTSTGSGEIDSKHSFSDDDGGCGDVEHDLSDGEQGSPKVGRLSPVTTNTLESSQSVDTEHFTPVKAPCKDTTLCFDTPLKTPLKNLLDECSRDAFRSPKRKSQAPKRRSFDPSSSKEAPLVTPVKSQEPILSMPLFEELVNNTKFAEKLACSINQALCPEKEGIEEAKTLNEQSSQEIAETKEPDKTTDENMESSLKVKTIVTPKKPTLRCKNTPSPKPRPKKRVSFEKSEAVETSPATNTTGTEGNESTGSIKPPLSVDELDSILEDTQMSESTIQGIINMTQNDPELDALFNLINMDKQEFIEKEYGISLSDYKFSTTPKKSSADGLELGSTSQVTSSTYVSQVRSMPAATSVFSLSTMSVSNSAGFKPNDVAPVSSTMSSLPLIHVSTVSSTSSSSASTPSSQGGFLQLLHSATDSQDSYVETVQMIGNQQQNIEVNGTKTQNCGENFTEAEEYSHSKGTGRISEMISKKSDDTESVDSNSSEYTALELPNGVKVDVMPVGTDINSQYQTLQTLTHLQKLLHSGCSLTAAGPAVSKSSPCGSTSVVTPVKVVSNPRGSSSETSPGTSSLIETVNNQGLVMRTQPKLDTVDTRGLGLVSFQDETPVEEDQAEETSLTEHSTGKKKRGRPVVRKQGARKCKGRNTPLQKPSTTGPIPAVSQSTSPKGRRVGIRVPRNEVRKNLSIPSTVVIPSSIQEKTKGRPILTTIDSKPVLLTPVTVDANQNKANISMIQKWSSTQNRNVSSVINVLNQKSSNTGTSLLRKTLLDASAETPVIQSIQQVPQSTGLTNVTGTVIRSNAVVDTNVQKSSNVPSTPSNDPSPRRQLFGRSKKSGKGMSQLAALINKSSASHSSDCQSRVDVSTRGPQSMGSMIFSPKSSKAGAMFSRPMGNYRNPDSEGNKINTNSGTDTVVDVSTVTSIFKTPTTPVTDTVVDVSTVTNIFKTPTKPVDGKGVNHSYTNVSQKLKVADSTGLISMPTDFSVLISQSPLKSGAFKSPQKMIAQPKARRIPLKTLRPGEGEENFETNFPNLVSNTELLSQPGDVVEILSPNSSLQGTAMQNTGPAETESVSVESAMKSMEGSIDVETAQTLIKFASQAVVTPKKFEPDVDQNSNHCIVGRSDLGVIEVKDRDNNGKRATKQSSSKKKEKSSGRSNKGSEKKKRRKSCDTGEKRSLRSSSRLSKKNVQEVEEVCIDPDRDGSDVVELDKSITDENVDTHDVGGDMSGSGKKCKKGSGKKRSPRDKMVTQTVNSRLDEEKVAGAHSEGNLDESVRDGSFITKGESGYDLNKSVIDQIEDNDEVIAEIPLENATSVVQELKDKNLVVKKLEDNIGEAEVEKPVKKLKSPRSSSKVKQSNVQHTKGQRRKSNKKLKTKNKESDRLSVDSTTKSVPTQDSTAITSDSIGNSSKIASGLLQTVTKDNEIMVNVNEKSGGDKLCETPKVLKKQESPDISVNKSKCKDIEKDKPIENSGKGSSGEDCTESKACGKTGSAEKIGVVASEAFEEEKRRGISGISFGVADTLEGEKHDFSSGDESVICTETVKQLWEAGELSSSESESTSDKTVDIEKESRSNNCSEKQVDDKSNVLDWEKLTGQDETMGDIYRNTKTSEEYIEQSPLDNDRMSRGDLEKVNSGQCQMAGVIQRESITISEKEKRGELRKNEESVKSNKAILRVDDTFTSENATLHKSKDKSLTATSGVKGFCSEYVERKTEIYVEDTLVSPKQGQGSNIGKDTPQGEGETTETGKIVHANSENSFEISADFATPEKSTSECSDEAVSEKLHNMDMSVKSELMKSDKGSGKKKKKSMKLPQNVVVEHSSHKVTKSKASFDNSQNNKTLKTDKQSLQSKQATKGVDVSAVQRKTNNSSSEESNDHKVKQRKTSLQDHMLDHDALDTSEGSLKDQQGTDRPDKLMSEEIDNTVRVRPCNSEKAIGTDAASVKEGTSKVTQSTKTPQTLAAQGKASETLKSPFGAFPLAKLVEQARKEMMQVKPSPPISTTKSPRKGEKSLKMAVSPSLFGSKSPRSTKVREMKEVDVEQEKAALMSVGVGSKSGSSGGMEKRGEKRKPEKVPEGETDRQHKKHKAYQQDMRGLSRLLSNTSKLEKSLMKIRMLSDSLENK